MSNVSSILVNFGKAVLLVGLFALAPLAAQAEGTDLEKGAKGTITEPTGKPDPLVETQKSKATMANPNQEGVDLEKGSRGNIAEPDYKDTTNKKPETGGKRIPQQSPDMEGVDLQKGAKTSIN